MCWPESVGEEEGARIEEGDSLQLLCISGCTLQNKCTSRYTFHWKTVAKAVMQQKSKDR